VEKPLTIVEIKQKVSPVAKQYGLRRAFLFGSYARGEAVPESDIDICIEEGKSLSLFELSGFYLDLEETIGAKLDLVTESALKGSFRETVEKERVLIYG
jgi:predicted nucleotidyltransferase